MLLCNHAGHAARHAIAGLRPPEGTIDGHIGAEKLACALADRLHCPLILQRYSRLVIDRNRPPGSDGSIPVLSHGLRVPANLGLAAHDRHLRKRDPLIPSMMRPPPRLTPAPRRRVFSIHPFGDCLLDKPIGKAWCNLNRLEVFALSVLSAPYMHDEAAAFAHVEAMLWVDGPVCPHCGVVDAAYALKGVRTKASKKNPEGKERHGLWKCRECRKQFTVRKGTIFEESHLPLHLWLQVIHLMVSSKKGISSHQLHRVLGTTYKSAWFLTHRIRGCMRDGALAPFGGNGGTVEVDETFIGKKADKPKGARGYAHKNAMLTLVDRDTKRAKTIVVDDIKKDTLVPILRENIAREAVIYTDEAK